MWQSVTRPNSSGQSAPPSLYAFGGNYDDDNDDDDDDDDDGDDDNDVDDLAAREC